MPTPERRIVRWLIGAACALLAGSALAAPPTASVSGAWIRLLPGDLPLAGYFTLHNNDTKPLKLTGATSPAFKRIELHHSMTMHGMDEMKPIKVAVAPANNALTFAPGGYHLMMWRSRPLKAGMHVPVTLKFADGQHLKVEFTVKRPGQ
ncbi:MAG TPA: copper chaperone PCu(A)C [Gammaproteobacteria bacterium]|nr:copper chaperone PCu(A)C [Gammaproteobacteria bacterium]